MTAQCGPGLPFAMSDCNKESSPQLQPPMDPMEQFNQLEGAKKKYLFGPQPTIFHRFEDIPAPGGIRMLTRIIEAYEIQHGSASGIVDFDLAAGSIPWYDSDGRKNFQCHPLNEREHDSVIESYQRSSGFVI